MVLKGFYLTLSHFLLFSVIQDCKESLNTSSFSKKALLFFLYSNWVLDAKKSQIWQTPISYRMRQLIMEIDFLKIKYMLRKHGFNSTQKTHPRQRIRKIQSIIRRNQEATLEDIVEGMGGFNQAIFILKNRE